MLWERLRIHTECPPVSSGEFEADLRDPRLEPCLPDPYISTRQLYQCKVFTCLLCYPLPSTKEPVQMSIMCITGKTTVRGMFCNAEVSASNRTAWVQEGTSRLVARHRYTYLLQSTTVRAKRRGVSRFCRSRFPCRCPCSTLLDYGTTSKQKPSGPSILIGRRSEAAWKKSQTLTNSERRRFQHNTVLVPLAAFGFAFRDINCQFNGKIMMRSWAKVCKMRIF